MVLGCVGSCAGQGAVGVGEVALRATRAQALLDALEGARCAGMGDEWNRGEAFLRKSGSVTATGPAAAMGEACRACLVGEACRRWAQVEGYTGWAAGVTWVQGRPMRVLPEERETVGKQQPAVGA